MINSPLKSIHEWRRSIYESALSAICDPSLQTIQEATGIWDWHHGIPLPKRENAVVIDGSVMNVVVKTDGLGDILFGVWMFMGEVRIGARIPKKILSRSDDLQIDLPDCYDGNPCSRVAHFNEMILFDWIFKTGFASTEVMMMSFRDDIVKQSIADAIANIVTHLYMSVVNLVITHAGMVVSPSSEGFHSEEHCVQAVIELKGDQERARSILIGMGVHVNDIWPQEDGRVFLLVLIADVNNAQEIKECMHDNNIEAVVRLTKNNKNG